MEDWISQVREKPFLDVRQYNFAPQTPGGSLSVGSSSFTMSPVPPGVIIGSTLYLSGGTGAAEVVPITGVSGSTVTVTCANTHSGAWTVQSVSFGSQEAINLANAVGGGSVYVPGGTWTAFGPITIPGSGVKVFGAGRLATTISTSYAGGPFISAPNSGDQISISDMTLSGPGTGANFGISLVDQSNEVVERLSIRHFPQGISLTGNSNSALGVFRDLTINFLTGDGAYINTTIDGGTWENVSYGASPAGATNGMHVQAAVGLRVKYIYTNGLQNGILFSPGAGQVVGAVQIWNAYLDGFAASSGSQYGIRFSPSGGGIINTVTIDQGAAAGWNIGILFDGTGTTEDIAFAKFLVLGNTAAGISATTSTNTVKNLFFNDCLVEGNSSSSAGSNPGVNIQFATNVVIKGGVFAAGSYGAGANSQSYGITIGGGTTNVLIDGPVVTPNITGSIQIGGTNTGLIVKNAVGYNPVGISTVTVSSSTFTYTNGSSSATAYIQGGTVTSVLVGGGPGTGKTVTNTTIPAGQSLIVPLSPNEILYIASSASPTMFVDVQ